MTITRNPREELAAKAIAESFASPDVLWENWLPQAHAVLEALSAAPGNPREAALERVAEVAQKLLDVTMEGRFRYPNQEFIDLEHALSALRRTLPAADGGWRPISEAPKDGTPVDLWCVHEEMGGMRSPDMWWNDSAWRDWQGLPLNPGWASTHWMPRPLPPPPVPQTCTCEYDLSGNGDRLRVYRFGCPQHDHNP